VFRAARGKQDSRPLAVRSASGELFYDRDGSGQKAAALAAIVGQVTELSADDFLIV